VSSTTSFPDFVFVPPKANTEAAAVRSLAVAAPHSDPALTGDASAPAAALGLSANELLNRPSVAALCERLPESDDEQTAEKEAEAGRGDSEVPFGRIDFVAHDTPINSAPRVDADELIRDFGIRSALSPCHFGIPSEANSLIDADLETAITALELSWLRAGILMNAATLATIAASESFSNSTSSVGA